MNLSSQLTTLKFYIEFIFIENLPFGCHYQSGIFVKFLLTGVFPESETFSSNEVVLFVERGAVLVKEGFPSPCAQGSPGVLRLHKAPGVTFENPTGHCSWIFFFFSRYDWFKTWKIVPTWHFLKMLVPFKNFQLSLKHSHKLQKIRSFLRRLIETFRHGASGSKQPLQWVLLSPEQSRTEVSFGDRNKSQDEPAPRPVWTDLGLHGRLGPKCLECIT